MADLPSELRTLVDRYGAHVLDDADGLRATLNDFLDEDISPGDVNLLVDAVRFGALERFRTLLDQGAEPAAAMNDVAQGLAQRRGGDAESAYWACAVLGYGADLLSADLIPGSQERPSSLLAQSATHDSAQTESAHETHVVGQVKDAPHSDPNATRSSGEPATLGPVNDHVTERADASLAEHKTSGARRSRAALVAVAAVLALIIAGVVAFVLTRSLSEEPTAMHGAGHDVPIETVTVKDTFGHFGTPATMNKVLKSPCINAALDNADYQQYRCAFKVRPNFFIDFNNGDALTKDAKGKLPKSVTNPGPGNIVTVQPSTAGSGSLHAYVMKKLDAGVDKIPDTSDDVVTLTLYDVDTVHPGSAEFKSLKANSAPLTRDLANELLQSIGVDENKFPLPKPFKGTVNESTGSSPLKQFAQRFLTLKELGSCQEGFLVVTGETEHVKCFSARDPKASAYVVSFGLQRENPGLRAAQRLFQGPAWSWSDKQTRGRILRSKSVYGGISRLFWYEEDTGGDARWGLLASRTKNFDDLRKIFEGFADRPKVTTTH